MEIGFFFFGLFIIIYLWCGLFPHLMEELLRAGVGHAMELEEAERARASGGGGVCSAAGLDRLSSLPDCVLHTIMSFMKARQVVQTCVLSKRWRHLWRSVPCLDVDVDEFKTVPVSDRNSGSGGDDNSGSGCDDNSASGGDDNSVSVGDDNSGSGGEDNSDSEEDSSESSESETSDSDDIPDSDGNSSESDLESSDSYSDSDIITTSEEDISDSEYSYMYGANIDSDKVKNKEWEDFEDFTVNLMRQCNIAQLDSFRLHIAGSRAPKFSNRQAAGWLRRAMKYCTPDWPSQHGGVGSGSWHLKSLHLCHVFLDDGFMKRVNSVCRCLEDLELDDCSCEIQSVTSQSLKTMVLKHCKWRNLSVIASPTLKTLVIDGGSNTYNCGLVIFAPAVSHLVLAVRTHQFRGGVSINEVSSLTKASIHLKGHRYGISMSSKLDYDQSKLLCSISNVTSLEFSGVGATVLGKETRFQKFKNLRNLMLNKCDLSDDFHILVFFLQSSPILEKLTLGHCKFPEFSDKKKGTPKVKKTSSSALRGLDLLCESLKVEIIYKCDHGRHLVQLLLGISVNLLEKNIKLTRVN